jgi:L-ascorbate metabolism protein UlaG (beta-lactamase superfamily)
MKLKSSLARIAAITALISLPSLAAAETKLTWFGHAAFKIETPAGKVLLIDPWIKNPANKTADADLAKLDKVDLILVTHGHGDHIGNSVELGKKTGAGLVATFDLAKAIAQYQGYPEKQVGGAFTGNFGGEISLLDGEVKIAFIPAVHSSSVAATEGKDLYAGGNPGGFLVTVKNGPTFYHTGDTDLFGDMALIPGFRQVDVMLSTIGDKFTMGPTRAAEAVKLVKPAKMVVPMHFGTFSFLTGAPAAFATALKEAKVATPMREMKIGETISF